MASQEIIIIFRCITEASEILAQHYNDIRAFLPSLTDELQLVEASLTSFIIASNNDLFLLYCQRQ